MKLDDLRKQIDGLDRQILEILRKRFDIAGKIALVKDEKGIPVENKKREKEVVKNLIRKGKKLKLPASFISQLINLIINESKRIQEKL